MHLRLGPVPLALLFYALPFHAQSVSGAGQPRVDTFKAETRAVEVDVLVLDARGKPVTGLGQGDFLVSEDGHPQTVTFFEEHRAEAAAQNAVNVLLIDTLNTPKEDLGFARKQIADSLKKMPAGTPLAVFSLGQTLRMVQGFTSDRGLLLAAVNNEKSGAWSETSAASNMPADDADDKVRTEMLKGAQAVPNSEDMVRNAQAMHNTYQSNQRIAMTVAAMERLARYLAKTPGRKNLIWFSTAFPIALFPEPGVQGSVTTTEQNQQIKNATDLLALARVAIYPLSAQGVPVETAGDATDHYGAVQAASPGAAAGVAPPSGTSLQSTGGDQYQYGALPDGMRHENGALAAKYAAMGALAAETGGVMMPTSNDLNRAMTRAIENGSRYYTLSYAPTNTKADGSFRRIAVKLRSGQYQLAYRQGYYATDKMLGVTAKPATNMANAAKAVSGDPLSPLMRNGMASMTQVPYEAHLEPVQPQPAADAARIGGNAKVTGPVTRYRADFVIRRAGEDLKPAQDGTHKDRMQVEVIAYDANGKPLNWQAGAVNLTPEDDANAKGKGIRTHMEIDVPKGASSVVTGVYDWSTNQAGTREISLSSLAVQPASASNNPPSQLPMTAGAPSSETASSHTPGLVHRTPEAATKEQTAARRIQLNVVVTDASGHPVSGLEQPDFTVLDNNSAQPIQSFRAVDGLAAPPPVEIVLVLDTMNTSFQQMAAVRQGAEKFLRQNGGHLALPVSAVFLTDTGVKANQTTRDGNALAADIENLPAPVHVINSAQGLDGLMLRFGRSVDALSQITRYEATQPGKKLVIWIGDGWPMLANARYHKDPRNQSSFFHSIVDLSTSLREAHVTLYGVIPLDLNKGTEAVAYLYQNFMKGVESAKEAEAGNLSLQVLAEQSGGLAIGPTGDIYGGIVRCVADSNSYYELAFDSVPASRVDVYHALSVRLNKPGLTARTNMGYYAQP